MQRNTNYSSVSSSDKYECPRCQERAVEADVNEYRCGNCNECWSDLVDLATSEPVSYDAQFMLTQACDYDG
jgi:ribosomal protein L37AE/L43A